jgi:competence protein ComEC
MRACILAFACAVACLQVQAELPSFAELAVLAGGAAAAVAGAVRGPRWVASVLRLLGFAFAGFCWAAFLAGQRLSDALPSEWEVRDIEVTGVVAALPQRLERGERFEFDVEAVHTNGAHVPRHVLLSWYRDWDDVDEGREGDDLAKPVRPGERWRFTVRLKRPHGAANPHAYDYEAWLLERDIRATGIIRGNQASRRLEGFVWRPGYLVERARDHIRERFLTTLPAAPYLGVLIALVVGDQRAIPNAQWLTFNRTGITHLVSISGLHVTMIAALFATFVGALWRRSETLVLKLPAQKAALVAGFFAAFAYALLAGFEVPAQRTLYMLSVVAVTLWSGRNFGVSRTLLCALFVVLVLDPWAVLATGFWLSFGAVALLFYVGSARVSAARGWRETLAQWGSAQWAVTVGSVPLLLLFFQQFSLVSPLANALAIPFVSFVVTPLALLFALLPWPPLLHLDHWLLALLMDVLETLSGWPVWQQAAPPLAAIFTALFGVLWLLLPRGFPARWLGLAFLLPALLLPPPRPQAGEAWIDVLDVGQGLAVVVRTAAHTLAYDAGPLYSASSDAGARVVLPFLRASGIDALDALVVSHRDKDHSGGVAALREGLPIARIVSSLAELPGEPCVAGQDWEWDGVRFAILHPAPADYAAPAKKSNNMSCVLRVASVGGSALLTADIEASDERALVANAAKALTSDVLLVPHHGGAASSTPRFIATVGARDAVFSAGYRNSFRHPRPEVLARHAASRQWRTDRDGAIRIALANAVEVSAWRDEKRRYWHDR